MPSLRQRLDWIDGEGDVLFEEERLIGCQVHGASGVRWTWRTRLRSLRDTVLRQSPWAEVNRHGDRISYHGLGLRFPRSFGGLSSRTAPFTASGPLTFDDALGAAPRELGIVGEIDGAWPPPLAAVTIAQLTTKDAFFALRDPFTYLSVGPSNAGPIPVGKGDVIRADYEILVEDRGLAGAGRREADRGEAD